MELGVNITSDRKWMSDGGWLRLRRKGRSMGGKVTRAETILIIKIRK